MAQIFISYSRKDINFVRQLAGDLEKAGYEVWWDLTDLRGGDDWPRVIPAAIESSQYVIVVLSPNSAVSDWVEKEYTQALSLHKKIIPIMLANSRVPFSLNTINYIDFTGADYAASLNNLLSTLGYTGKMPVVPAATLPGMLRKYAIPIILAVVVLLALLSIRFLNPEVVPTPTVIPTSSAIPSVTSTLSLATETSTSTATQSPTASQSATLTSTPTNTSTQSPTVTQTPSPTNQPLSRLGLCITSDYANSINVRSGPGTIYAPLGAPLLVDTCLFFSARNEESTWLQIAPNQPDISLKQYEGGWIFRELLELKPTSSVDLPAVTLTPTPTPSETPSITPTFTRTPTETLTPTETPSLNETATPTETPTP